MPSLSTARQHANAHLLMENSVRVLRTTAFAPRVLALMTMSSVPPGPSPLLPSHRAISVALLRAGASALWSIHRLLRAHSP